MDDRRRSNHTTAPHVYHTQPVATEPGSFTRPSGYGRESSIDEPGDSTGGDVGELRSTWNVVNSGMT